MVSAQYPWGIDCYWIASDAQGDVAVFITAGSGPIPIMALNHEGVSISEVGDLIDELPIVSVVKLLVDNIASMDSYISLSGLGLYVYDWTDVHSSKSFETGAYEAITRPANPIQVDALAHKLQTAAEKIAFPTLTFSSSNQIDARKYFECMDAESTC